MPDEEFGFPQRSGMATIRDGSKVEGPDEMMKLQPPA